MAETHETIADIIAEMRRGTRLPGYWRSCDVNKILQYHADRLEAAHRREIEALKQRLNELDAEVAAKDEVIKRLNDAIAEEQKRKMATAENPSAVGNAAKLREALVYVNEHTYRDDNDDLREEGCRRIEDVIEAALAAPARNCDVGVPEERIQRWSKFCKARSKKLPPIHGFEWEDYPYEEGGDK